MVLASRKQRARIRGRRPAARRTRRRGACIGHAADLTAATSRRQHAATMRQRAVRPLAARFRTTPHRGGGLPSTPICCASPSGPGSIHVERYGHGGAPIVLLHGFGTSSFLWRNIAPEIALANRTAFALDLFGYGESDRPFDADFGIAAQAELVDRALTALRLPKATVVGLDLGGAVALRLAATPARARRAAAARQPDRARRDPGGRRDLAPAQHRSLRLPRRRAASSAPRRSSARCFARASPTRRTCRTSSSLATWHLTSATRG